MSAAGPAAGTSGAAALTLRFGPGTHADPTWARHGVLRGQVDICARAIWWAERAGWVRELRWPDEECLARKVSGGARSGRFGTMTSRQPQ